MPIQNASIVISPNADALVCLASDELQKYLQKLFGLKVNIVHSLDDAATCRFIIGQANDKLVKNVSASLPNLSKQGFIVRRVNASTMILIGGGGQSAAWAVYELIERYGVRYLMLEDSFPTDPGPFHLPDIDQKFEPLIEIRSWRPMSELGYGPLIWSLDQHKKVLRQMLKLKYNAVHLSSWPHMPLVGMQYDNIHQRTGETLFGQKFPIDEMTIGREHYPDDMKMLTPPALHGAETFSEKLQAWQGFWNNVLDESQSLGMYTSMNVQPLEFPAEYRPLLQNPTEEDVQVGSLVCSERGDLTNPGHMQLVYATVKAYIEQWGRVDKFLLGAPEHPHAEANFERCWRQLDERFDLSSEFSIETLLQEAQNDHRTNEGNPGRAQREFKSAVAMVHFYHHFFDTTDLLELAKQSELQVGLGLGKPLPFIHKVLWPDAAVQIQLDYTSMRAAHRLESLECIATDKIDAAQVITFQDDNIGWFPQISAHSIDMIVKKLISCGFKELSTRYWPIGDLDLMATHLARVCWDKNICVADTYRDYFRHVYSEDDVEAMCQVMRLLEDATILLDVSQKWMLFPIIDYIGFSYIEYPREITCEFYFILACYRNTRRLLRKRRSEPGSDARNKHLNYWIGRLTFAIEALKAVEQISTGSIAVKKTKQARANGDDAEAQECLHRAQHCYEQALEFGESTVHIADAVAKDDSDRAAVIIHYHNFVRSVKEHSEKHIKAI